MHEGDCKSCIHLWEPTSGATWNVDATPFTGHTASVEDIQVHDLLLNPIKLTPLNFSIL
jgi:hypothetical protein